MQTTTPHELRTGWLPVIAFLVAATTMAGYLVTIGLPGNVDTADLGVMFVRTVSFLIVLGLFLGATAWLVCVRADSRITGVRRTLYNGVRAFAAAGFAAGLLWGAYLNATAY